MKPRIVDVGTLNCRTGEAGEAVPRVTRSRLKSETCARGRIVNFDNVVELVASSKSSSSPSRTTTADVGGSLLVVESVWERHEETAKLRKQWSELAFEKMRCESIFFHLAPVLSCYANARQTALVVDMSACGVSGTAVLDGWVVRGGTNLEFSELGGNDLDEWLLRQRAVGTADNAHGSSSSPPSDVEAMRALRESSSRAGADEFRLPDGTAVKVSEILFDPSPLRQESRYTGLHELAFTAATKHTTTEIRRTLLGNVVLCGGLSRSAGVPQRLVDEIANMAALDQPRVIVAAPDDRAHSAFLGASILGSLSAYREFAVSKNEYEENGGLDAVQRKCP